MYNRIPAGSISWSRREETLLLQTSPSADRQHDGGGWIHIRRHDHLGEENGRAALGGTWTLFFSSQTPDPQLPLLFVCILRNDEELECQTGDLSELSEEDFEPLTQSIWYVAPEHKAYGSNPCPMPLKLAEDIIKMWSFKGDLCVDIFGGSGTTAVAALRQERHYIHIDCSPTCCADAQRRIAEEKKKLNQNDGSKKAA